MKEGNLISLTRRYKKPNYRIFISYMIAKLTKRKGQPIDKVKVHSAIIYKRDGIFMVREMEKDGDSHQTLEDYLIEYKDRVEIKEHPYSFKPEELATFNYLCRYLKVTYDYRNTFLWQVVKYFTGKFLGKQTMYSRMCAEDFQDQFNVLKYGYFKTPEITNPNEVHSLVKEWKIIYINNHYVN